MYNVRVAVWQVECQVILINTSVPGVSERIGVTGTTKQKIAVGMK